MDLPDYTVCTGVGGIGRIYETRGGADSLRWFSLTIGPMTRPDRVATLGRLRPSFQNSGDTWKAGRSWKRCPNVKWQNLNGLTNSPSTSRARDSRDCFLQNHSTSKPAYEGLKLESDPFCDLGERQSFSVQDNEARAGARERCPAAVLGAVVPLFVDALQGQPWRARTHVV
jgi:hypothetical protein